MRQTVVIGLCDCDARRSDCFAYHQSVVKTDAMQMRHKTGNGCFDVQNSFRNTAKTIPNLTKSGRRFVKRPDDNIKIFLRHLKTPNKPASRLIHYMANIQSLRWFCLSDQPARTSRTKTDRFLVFFRILDGVKIAHQLTCNIGHSRQRLTHQDWFIIQIKSLIALIGFGLHNNQINKCLDGLIFRKSGCFLCSLLNSPQSNSPAYKTNGSPSPHSATSMRVRVDDLFARICSPSLDMVHPVCLVIQLFQ